MNSRAFPVLVSVFFFWGFMAASNDILIPVFKEKLNLEQWQSQLIQIAYYVAYTVGSVIYFIISKILGQDLLNKLGYKNGVSLGLTISALGTLLFYPAAETASFGLLISGLFIVALGFSLQQTAANPLAIVLGDPKLGSQRLSLAGGVNNVGTTIGPLLLSFAIFGTLSAGSSEASIESVKIPYLILGAAFILVAIIFKVSGIPNKLEAANVSPQAADDKNERSSALRYPQLLLGMLAIFVYVGVEVSTASNLPEFMKQTLGTKPAEVAPFVSLFWASLMIGRWTSSVGAFSKHEVFRLVFRFVMPYIAFGVFLLVNKLVGNDISTFYVYGLIIPVLILGDFLSKGSPSRQLLIYSTFGVLALILGMLTSGMVSVFCFISVGLFCSTLWPCIFTLAIAGLGKHTNQGSGFLIMMIMGGGIISFLQGWLSDNDLLGIRWSYLVGVICFLYLGLYAILTKNILKKQQIER